MPSFVKNSVYCFLISCIIGACDQKTDVIDRASVSKDSTGLISVKSYTILLSGMIPPPMYSNALDIVAKIYNVNFAYAAGCIVDERIGDSISKCNERTFADLKKQFNKDMAKEIYDGLDIETAFLTRLDSSIRKDPEIKKLKQLNEQLIYYSKKEGNYLAHFIVSEPDNKVLNFKLKLVATVDSANKFISNITEKDSIIKQFSDLQL